MDALRSVLVLILFVTVAVARGNGGTIPTYPSIGAFERDAWSGVSLMNGPDSGFAFRFVGPVEELVDPNTFEECITEAGPCAADASYARLRWRPRPDPPGSFAVKWTGVLNVIQAGDYRLAVHASGGARLRIDGRLVLNLRPGRESSSGEASRALSRGKHALELEFRHLRGLPYIKLLWGSTNDKSLEAVPAVLLSNGDNAGLQATYFLDPQMRQMAGQRIDPNVFFEWAIPDPLSNFRHSVPERLPELTLEWSRVTSSTVVGRVSASGGTIANTTLTLVGHFPVGVRGMVRCPVPTEMEFDCDGTHGNLSFLRPPMTTQSGRTLADLCDALTSEAPQPDPRDPNAFAAMTFNASSATPVYFTASLGPAERFYAKEIDARLEFARSRHSDERIRSEGAFAGTAEGLANAVRWLLVQTHDGSHRLRGSLQQTGTSTPQSETTDLLMPGALMLTVLDREAALHQIEHALETDHSGALPLAAYYCWKVYLRAGLDKDWLKRIFPQLVARVQNAPPPTQGDVLVRAIDALCLIKISVELESPLDEKRWRSEHSRIVGGLDLATIPEPDAFMAFGAGIGDQPQLENLVGRLASPRNGWNRWPLRCPGEDGSHAVVRPEINYLVYDGLKNRGQHEEAATLAEKSAMLFTGNLTSEGSFSERYNADSGTGEGKRFHLLSALLPFTALCEFADVDMDGRLRFGSLSSVSASIHNLPLGGAIYGIQLSPNGLTVKRNGITLLTTTCPAVVALRAESADGIHVEITATKPGEMRIGDHQIRRVKMDNATETTVPATALRFAGGTHTYEVGF